MWWPEFFLQPRKMWQAVFTFCPHLWRSYTLTKTLKQLLLFYIIFSYGKFYVQFENMFFNVKSLWFFGLFYSVKNRHPFFSILILSSLSLHLWFFMSTTWQNITFPSRKMLLSSWVFEVTHLCSEIEGGCWLPPFFG